MLNPAAKLIQARLRSPVTAITAYDYPTGRICDEAGIQLILVGDTLGMVVAGNEDTTTVTLDQMVYHTEMVRRGVNQAVLISDLPIDTYRTPEEALESARRLQEAGADGVKLEGGFQQVEIINSLCAQDISVCGHLGMLPQRVKEEGGFYRKKGKTDEEAERLVEAAVAIEEAGVFAMVLESMVAPVAKEITEKVGVPTLGIGAGSGCSGQIRVLHDVVGGYPWFVPPFAKVYGNVAEVTKKAIENYISDSHN